MSVLDTIQGCAINYSSDKIRNTEVVSFTSDADIDADGANGQFGGAAAYLPNNKGLDSNFNAKSGGIWVGVETDSHGNALNQGPNDPTPGAYVSTTKLVLPGVRGPRRYIDSFSIPYFVIPPIIVKSTRFACFGCRGTLIYKGSPLLECVVADEGPSRAIGEISIAAARILGIDFNARDGGVSEHEVEYVLYPGVPAVVQGVTYTLMHADGTFVV